MQELNRIKVDIFDLKLGMFVSALDRPWSQTSFPLQGFLVRSNRELSALRSVCQYVYVDHAKCVMADASEKKKLLQIAEGKVVKPTEVVRKSSKPIQIDRERYVTKIDLPSDKDMAHAQNNFSTIQTSLESLHQQIEEGATVSSETVKGCSNTLVQSVIDTPTAAAWVVMLRRGEKSTFDHGLRAATWALICGRNIGLEEHEMQRMALGILLKDVYRLQKNTKVESVADAITLSVQLLRESEVHPKVISVVKYHREKFNGSGQPNGLAGEKIPFLARIAAIAIGYDRIVFNPRKERSLPPSQAAKILYNEKGKAFQEELVVEFIEAIGLYPLGTIVKLSSGETAMVVKQNPDRKLKPEVLLLKDQDGRALEIEEQRRIDLYSEDSNVDSLIIDRDMPNFLPADIMSRVFEEALNEPEETKNHRSGLLSRIFG